MRVFWIMLVVISIAFAGCSEPVGERKAAIALEKVPPEILKVATDKYPEVKFDAAFTEIEDGQPVYELKGKSKSGKNLEVEITKDGKLLEP